MPWCPKCKTEYREGFTACADCGEPLVDVLPADETPEEQEQPDLMEPVFLTTITNERELELFSQLLHTNQIPFFTRDLESGDYMRVYMGFSVYGQAIYVPKAFYPACQQLLAQMEGDYGDAEMQAAYEEYMENAEPEEQQNENEEDEQPASSGYGLLKVFAIIFGILLLLWFLNSIFVLW